MSYFIDADRGDDQNDGRSAGRAWRSLDRVNQAVFGPGDKLLFRAGTRYVGQLTRIFHRLWLRRYNAAALLPVMSGVDDTTGIARRQGHP